MWGRVVAVPLTRAPETICRVADRAKCCGAFPLPLPLGKERKWAAEERVKILAISVEPRFVYSGAVTP